MSLSVSRGKRCVPGTGVGGRDPCQVFMFLGLFLLYLSHFGKSHTLLLRTMERYGLNKIRPGVSTLLCYMKPRGRIEIVGHFS